MNQMNQIGINKQQKTQNNTKNKFRDIREIRWQKITHCASHLVHPVRLVTKKKKDSCYSCHPLATKKFVVKNIN